MARCFVIQPFDQGPYDKRYRDIVRPAILAAELDPYRIDEDPSTTILIEDIEQGIRESEICLADITTDNPNIWYEVGFAFANGKTVVLMCSEPRPKPYPFDIQHRFVISYSQDSTSDFRTLERRLTERLRAQLEKAEKLQTVASLSPVKTTEGLSSYEMAVMVSILESRLTPDSSVSPRNIQDDMRRAGFTDVACSLSIESLLRMGMIVFETEGGNYNDPYPVYRLSEKGMNWMLDNRARFQMTAAPTSDAAPEISDDDIPF
ncbi:MAG TPA: hypothetical protein VFO34_14725 [Candidatus Acidoferrales bacterium]|nr:hypothetical protein [Candidatus Acidoferrales bacterium]